jgi:hypothetical protein
MCNVTQFSIFRKDNGKSTRYKEVSLMSRTQALILTGVLVLSFASLSFAQTVNTTSDSQAPALATKATVALTGGTPVTDVTLNATVTWIAGSEYLTGTGTFQAKGTSESRVDLDLGGVTRSEVRALADGIPQGSWIKAATTAASPTPRHYAPHNCWSDAAWFFPALTELASSDGSTTVSYLGTEQRAGVSVYHLRFYKSSQFLASQSASASDIALIQKWSAEDFYLDTTSLLPVAIAFKIHPDSNAAIEIPVEVRFSNYQAVEGVLVPMHIQKYLQGGLALDVSVTGVVINSGLQSTDFTIR